MKTQPKIVNYPSANANRPVCRQYTLRGHCSKGVTCLFYHAPVITASIKRKAQREPGFCFCGARLVTIQNAHRFRASDEADMPLFFCLCGRSKRSIKHCM